MMGLVWPRWTWVLTIFLELEEYNFTAVAPRRLEALGQWARGWLSTQISEEGIRQAKMKSRSSDRGKLTRAGRWHALSNSALFQKYGLKPVTPSEQDKCDSSGVEISEQQFSADSDDTSLGANDFDTILEEHGKGTYPQLTPAAFHLSGLRWESYLQQESFEELTQCWLTKLLQVGTILSYKPAGSQRKMLGIVIFVDDNFALMWRPSLALARDRIFLWTDTTDADKWHMVQIKSWQDYFVLTVKGLAPRHVFTRTTQYKLGFTSVHEEQPLLQAAARNAFRGMRVSELQKLFSALGVEMTPRPQKEVQILRALLGHCLPEATQQEINDIIALRSTRPDEDTVANVLTPEILEKNDKAFENDEYKEIKEALTKNPRAKAMTKTKVWMTRSMQQKKAQEPAAAQG